MKNIVIYCRVSTEEQKKHGFSLKSQKERLFNFARNNNYNILMHYEEDYSAKTFNRPQWKRMKKYCEKSYQTIDMVIFTKWDRFSRNAIEAHIEIDWFLEKEIEIYSVDNPLDFSIVESKITLAIYLTLSEVENDKISIRVKEGLRKAAREGCWTSTPPYGYTNYRTPNNKSTLMPDENAHYVHGAFILLASQEISVRQAWLSMRNEGMMVSSSQFYKMVRNTIYIGKIAVRSNEGSTEQVEGLHVPIITTALFEEVQTRLNKWHEKPPTQKGIRSHLYPLRGYIKCSRCSKNLTASASRGSNPNKKYHYYHCGDGCKERLPLKKAHELFVEYLNTITIDKNEFKIVKERIKLKVQKKEKLLVGKKEKLHQKIEKLKKTIARAEDRLFKGLVDSETFRNSKRRYADKINKCQDKMLKFKHFNSVFEFQNRIEKAKRFINLPKKFNDASPKEKKVLLDSILKGKISLYPNQISPHTSP